MSEFARIPASGNIFEGTSDEAIEIFLKIKDDFGDRYDGNENNEYKFAKAIEIIQSRSHTCYFLKQKEFTNTNKVTGKSFTESNHKIIIPLENDKSFEVIVALREDRINTFTQLYSYRVVKFKEGTFTNESKNPIKRNCIFKVIALEEKNGSDSERFKELYSLIESSPIPVVDINKEKDKQIWHNYVVAMKKLVKKKEQVWKIQKVSQPYSSSEMQGKEEERANYIDIYINEKELIDQLIEDIETLFNPDELEDYGVSDEKAYIEFKNYRELSQQELNQLKELGEEMFYELSATSPIHFISGQIQFKYTDTISKEEIYNTIKDKLNTDYQIEANISKDGYIDISDNDIPHLQKILTDNCSNLISLHRNNLVQLKVDFNSGKDLTLLKDKVKSILDSEGLSKSVVSVSSDRQFLIVEAEVFIHPKQFTNENLEFVHKVSRFSPSKYIQFRAIEGLEIVGNSYQIVSKNREEYDLAFNALRENFPGLYFYRKPTMYFFRPGNRVNLEVLRNFKTATDLQGKSEFIFANSTLNITADNKTDYNQQIQRIKTESPDALLQSKPFKPTYQIQFKTDLESRRQSIINKIQNEIRNAVNGKVEFDVIKNHTRVLFSYRFASDEEREKLKQAVSDACTPNQDIITFSIESDLGRSVYELYKNETLEIEKEKEVAGNIRSATFIYLNPEEKKQLSNEIELKGDEAYFKGGIQIGKLIKKERDRLKFRITDEFDERINAREEDRIDLNEIRQGYIKPIFPGELANIGRMIRAMKKVTEPSGRVGYPVNRNLSNFLFDPNEARQSATDIEEEKIRVLANLNEPLLKEQQKQLEAVVKTLVAKDLALIQGPPGTGKTTVIAEIIWQTLLREPQAKLLITSQTNLAVDNALGRIKGKKLVRPIRIGTTEKFEDEGKIYSSDRIKKWLQAKTNSSEEQLYAENAVCQWIENIQAKCSNEQKYARAVGKWKAGLHEKDFFIKKTFANAYYNYVNVFAATCSECGSKNFSETYQTTFQKNSESLIEPEFDLVIMDEASKATPPELVLPLTLGKKVVIIGDHKQLPPMIDEKDFEEALEERGAKKLIEDWTSSDYKISQFEKLFKNAPKNFVASLDTQFRMHEQIMNCISQFYTDQEELEHGLVCGIKNEMNIDDFNVKASRWHGIDIKPFVSQKDHAIWLNVDGPEIQEGEHFYSNDREVDAIYTVLKLLSSDASFQEYQEFMKTQREENQEIGVITFYGPQKNKIGRKLYPHLQPKDWMEFDKHKYENEFGIPFRINTVDKFQGMEKNIVIISTVRSHKQIRIDSKGKSTNKVNHKLGFAKEHPRINVGFSRAKRLLIVIGDEKHFSIRDEYATAIQKMHRVDLMQIQNLITQ